MVKMVNVFKKNRNGNLIIFSARLGDFCIALTSKHFRAALGNREFFKEF